MHWDEVYRQKAADRVSWYQPRPGVSLELIRNARLCSSEAIIDVGAGTSTLVDALLADGHTNITLLDLSSEALNLTRERLGGETRVRYAAVGVLTAPLAPSTYGLWHDRAVFHFLTSRHDQARYVQQAYEALKPGGALVLGTFALDGPNRCSGLEARQYSAESLSAVFAPYFQMLESRDEVHHTPAGQMQKFTVVRFQRRADHHDTGDAT